MMVMVTQPNILFSERNDRSWRNFFVDNHLFFGKQPKKLICFQGVYQDLLCRSSDQQQINITRSARIPRSPSPELPQNGPRLVAVFL